MNFRTSHTFPRTGSLSFQSGKDEMKTKSRTLKIFIVLRENYRTPTVFSY